MDGERRGRFTRARLLRTGVALGAGAGAGALGACAARGGDAGYFDVKAFGDQAAACAEYLSAGREVGIEGRLRFEEFETKSGDYASRVYIVADAVEFLASRRRDGSQADDAQGPGDQPESDQEGTS